MMMEKLNWKNLKKVKYEYLFLETPAKNVSTQFSINNKNLTMDQKLNIL